MGAQMAQTVSLCDLSLAVRLEILQVMPAIQVLNKCHKYHNASKSVSQVMPDRQWTASVTLQMMLQTIVTVTSTLRVPNGINHQSSNRDVPALRVHASTQAEYNVETTSCKKCE